jgi:secondary thiamine-phosphate synthase enzyme
MEVVDINTSKHEELIDITRIVENKVKESGVKDGVCTVFVPHTTASITINENADPTVKKDILRKLNEIIPWESGYSHAEGNSAAHIKSAIIGSGRAIIIKDGRLVLGAWQGIFFAEFDGPRRRNFYIETISK